MDIETLESYYDTKQTEIELASDRGFVIPDLHLNAIENRTKFKNYITNDNNLDIESSDFWDYRGLGGLYKVEKVTSNTKSYVLWESSNVKKVYLKINKLYQHQLRFQVYSNKNEDKLLLIYYFNSPEDKQISLKFVTLFHELIVAITNETKIKDIANVLVSNIEPSSESKNHLKTIPKTRVFLEDEFKYNPITHVYNQRFILLTPEEVKSLMVELKISKEKLPSLKYDDPVAKHYGFSLGDVVRIIRTERYVSVLAKTGCNYRIVVV